MVAAKLIAYLDSNQVQYVIITHSPAYSAQKIAQLAHLPGQEIAKCVIVTLNGKMAMAVLPAPYHIDLEALRTATGAEQIALCSEAEFLDRFPDCEVGAMPPFGNLYGMAVYVAAALAEDEEIAFNAGSHRELVRMPYNDFERLVEPHLFRFAVHD